MPKSLWLLIGLQCKGWGRSLLRSLKTVKGAITVAVGFLIFVPWIVSVFLVPDSAPGRLNPESLRAYGPIGLLGYCLLITLFSTGERALYFSPGEVNFLFAGPFTRRQLVLFKVMMSTLLGLLSALFFTLFFARHADWFLAAYVGLFLAFLFLQLASMLVNFLALSIGARAYSRARKIVLSIVIVMGIALLIQSGALQGGRIGIFKRMSQSEAWQIISYPLRCLIETFLTPSGEWLTLTQYAGLSILLNFILLLIVLMLDTHYLESAAASSEKIYQQIQRAKKGDWGWRKTGKKPTFRAPWLPYWGGIGPLAWQQLTTALRSLHRLMIILIAFVPAFLIGMVTTSDQQLSDDVAPILFLNLLFWVTLFMSNLLPFDFRGDLDRIEFLKTLPIPAWRIVIGQITTPVAMVTCGQILLIVLSQAIQGQWHTLFQLYLIIALPINMLMFGLDNLLFLWFPNRLVATNPADIQTIGRNTLLLLLKLLVLGIIVGAAGLLGALIYYLLGKSLIAGVLMGTIILMLAALAMIPLIALAFEKFDVTRIDA